METATTIVTTLDNLLNANQAVQAVKNVFDILPFGSFAGGGTVSGPESGYTMLTQFHGTEHIVPAGKAQTTDDKELKDLIRKLIAEVQEDGNYTRKIHRILDRVDAGEGSLLTRTE
jgi:hypothetical protein